MGQKTQIQFLNLYSVTDFENALIAGYSGFWCSEKTDNAEGAYSFIEFVFEFVTGEYDDGEKIFRKRKQGVCHDFNETKQK